jgi:hypothetical protein
MKRSVQSFAALKCINKSLLLNLEVVTLFTTSAASLKTQWTFQPPIQENLSSTVPVQGLECQYLFNAAFLPIRHDTNSKVEHR